MREYPKYRAWFHKESKMVDVVKLDFVNYTLSFYEGGEKPTEMPLDEFELMQNTCVNDKDGDEIYEGDIVATIHSSGVVYALVEFKNGSFVVSPIEEKTDVHLSLRDLKEYFKGLTIISNKFNYKEFT